MSDERGEIFSQEKMFSLLWGMNEKFSSLEVKLTETNGNLAVTNANMVKYNGLIEKVAAVQGELSEVKEMHIKCQAERQTTEKVEDKIDAKQDINQTQSALNLQNVILGLTFIGTIIALVRGGM